MAAANNNKIEEMNIKSDGVFDKLSSKILIISIGIIAFSFIAPIIFTQNYLFGLDFSKTGPIGDTIGGIMNPFIALSGVSLTFLAFYIQVIANKQQRESFRNELDEQKIQFKKNQFENQFYEMLRLHKDNVNEISLTLTHKYYNGQQDVINEKQIKARAVFKLYLYEIKILYYVAKGIYKGWNNNELLNRAYSTFFNGLEGAKRNIKNKADEEFIHELEKIQKVKNNIEFNNILSTYDITLEWQNIKAFEGQSTQLGHYYRHLFQTVKFVANQPNELLDYKEKRKYLRVLRAQLANQEQAMLFYNWAGGFGSKWEDGENKFFTDYRMIHNLFNSMLIDDFDLTEIFNFKKESNYKKEPNRDDDNLFDFEDWM